MIHELFAYLCVDDAPAAIAFYQTAFGASETFRLVEPSGRVGHAELAFGGATLMLSDVFPEHGIAAPAASAPPWSARSAMPSTAASAAASCATPTATAG